MACSENTDKCPRLFITIARLPGAGAISIGEKVAEYLNDHKKTDCPWNVYDKNLIKTVLENHNLPGNCEKYMPEGKINQIQDILDDLFEVRPPAITLVRKTNETILQLARMGNSILVGRGASIVTRKLENGFHVKLIGSLKKRIQRIMVFSKVDEKQAEKLVAKLEKDRKNYLKEYFNENFGDPLLYDLIINTDSISYDHAAKLIAETAFLTRSDQVLNSPYASAIY